MTLPEIRKELHELADKYNIPRLHELANEIRRRPSLHKSAPKQEPITDEQRAQVWFLYETTDLSQLEIAIRVGLKSQGRVSEILKGKRT